MTRFHAAFLAVLVSLAAGAVSPDRAFAESTLGTVSIQIIGPDGVPVHNHAVILKPIKLRVFSSISDASDVVSYAGHTDPSGRMSIQVPLGLFLAQIVVPGVGFGATGLVDVEPSATPSVTIPRLAPFATISGTVAPALIKPGAHAALDPNFGSQPSSALINAQGQFTLTDIWPGTVHLIIPEEIPAGTKPSYAFAESEVINVQPGDRFTGIHVVAPDSLALLPSPQAPTASVTKGPTIVGTVTDTKGKPASNVSIYAFISCQTIIDGGGHGRQQSVRTVATDANGKYALKDLPTGEPQFPGTDVSLIAVKPGTVPSVTTAHLMPDDTADAKNPRGDQTINLILPGQSPTLEIQVMQADKPVAGVRVQLSPHWGSLLDAAQYIIGGISADSPNPLDNLFHPSLTTDSDGVATFRGLAPGLWDVVSSYSQANQVTMTNESIGVIVRADRFNRYTLKLSNVTASIPVHVIAPTIQTKMNLQWIIAETTSSKGISVDANASLDSVGDCLLNLPASGLWRISTRFPCTPSNDLDVNEFGYEANAVFACAPDLLRPSSVVLRTVRVEPGSIHIKLRDRRGRPVMGSVFIQTMQLAMIAAGSTDERGEILFSNIPAGYYQMSASLLDSPPLPILGNETAPIPDDTKLIGHAVLVPEGAAARSDRLFGPSVSVQAGHETEAVFRLQPVGYIKGRLLAPPSDTFSDCQFDETSATGRIPQLQLLRNGKFVSGPYTEGKTEFRIERNGHGVYGEAVTGPPSRATVSSRHVTRVNVATSPPSPSQIRAAGAQAKEQEGEGPLNGRIFLSDGKTPAWAACAAVVRPDEWADTSSAATDALGRLSDNGSLLGVQMYNKSGSKRPVIVAYLPGSNGAVIAPYTPGRPVRLALPPPMSLHGKITVGGRSVKDLESTFTIQAAYKSGGDLNDLLSVETTAQADGTFDLAGLTPGVYQIQAVRDGIWLSQTQTITVGQAALSDRTFDIGMPGQAMLLHIRDASGHPLIGKTVRLMRPPGPLTDALWPKTLTTDGAGDLRIEGLEAGLQSITLQANDSSQATDTQKQDGRIIRFVLPDYSSEEQAVEKMVIVSGKPAND